MENKTDKPYSHKQAKNDIAKKYGYESWFDINFYQVDSNNVTTKAPYSEEVLRDEAAELYASKATEELRKANEELKAKIKQQDKEYVSNGSIQEWKDYSERTTAMIERLKESNKELVEALKVLYDDTVYTNMAGDQQFMWGRTGGTRLSKAALKAQTVIQKSEGDVNKKI